MHRYLSLFLIVQSLFVQASAPSAIEQKVANEHTAIEMSHFADLFRANQRPALREILNQAGFTGIPKELNEIIIDSVALRSAEEKAIEEKVMSEQKRYNEAAEAALKEAQMQPNQCLDARDNRSKFTAAIAVACIIIPTIIVAITLSSSNSNSRIPCLNMIGPNTNVTSLCWAAHFDRCCIPADYNFIIGDSNVNATNGAELKTFAENLAREQQCDPNSLFCLNTVGCDQVNPLHPRYFKNFNPCNKTIVNPTHYRRKIALARDKQLKKKKRN